MCIHFASESRADCTSTCLPRRLLEASGNRSYITRLLCQYPYRIKVPVCEHDNLGKDDRSKDRADKEREKRRVLGHVARECTAKNRQRRRFYERCGLHWSEVMRSTSNKARQLSFTDLSSRHASAVPHGEPVWERLADRSENYLNDTKRKI